MTRAKTEPTDEPESTVDHVAEHLRAALDGLAERRDEARGEERAAFHQAYDQVQSALALLDPRSRPRKAGALDEALARNAFGVFLRERRHLAKLSRGNLAERAGLSLSAIKGLESGNHAPQAETLRRLLAVAELNLGGEIESSEQSTRSGPLNSWMSPSYDQAELGQELVNLVNGRGGVMEQSHAYIDPASVNDWLRVVSSSRYATSFRAAAPLDHVAQRIAELAGGAPIDLVALGVGDGQAETRLASHLAELLPEPGRRLQVRLLDISHGLLKRGYEHAESVLAPLGVPVTALHANFHHLGQYPELHNGPADRRGLRVYTLLGYTMSNLTHEPRFYRQLRETAAPGDLCIVDFQHIYAPPERREEILAIDPPLAAGEPPPVQAEFIAGPFLRHCRGALDVRVSTELGQHCPVPRSYEVDFIVTAKLADGSARRWSAFRVKRYDPAALVACLAECGWVTDRQMDYGPEGAKRNSVLVLRRV